MNVLLLNQFFWPDAAATSQFLTDLARHLAAEGHNVTVICGRSRYAEADAGPPPPVTIIRAPQFQFGRGIAQRVMSYATLFPGILWRGLRIPAPDVVLSLTTPPLLSVVGDLLRRWRGARHYIWEMDVYPDVAIDLCVLSARSPVTRLIGAIADRIRRSADGVISLGPCMTERLAARGIPGNRIHEAENWADGALIAPRPFHEDGRLKLHYSGNLGLPHDVATILPAILAKKHDGRFLFLFAGGGSGRPPLERFCEDNAITNVRFAPYCRREELGGSLAEGDIGLVTQKTATAGSIVPSKIYGIMAAGRPILYIGPRDATPARIVRRFQCGWQIDCGDSASLLALLERLLENPELIRAAGARARTAFVANYDMPAGTARISRILAPVFAEVSAVK